MGKALPYPVLQNHKSQVAEGWEWAERTERRLKSLGNAHLRAVDILTPTPPQGSITNVRCAKSPVWERPR